MSDEPMRTPLRDDPCAKCGIYGPHSQALCAQRTASALEDERSVIVAWLRKQASGVRKVPGERSRHEESALLIASDCIARGDHMKGRASAQEDVAPDGSSWETACRRAWSERDDARRALRASDNKSPSVGYPHDPYVEFVRRIAQHPDVGDSLTAVEREVGWQHEAQAITGVRFQNHQRSDEAQPFWVGPPLTAYEEKFYERVRERKAEQKKAEQDPASALDETDIERTVRVFTDRIQWLHEAVVNGRKATWSADLAQSLRNLLRESEQRRASAFSDKEIVDGLRAALANQKVSYEVLEDRMLCMEDDRDHLGAFYRELAAMVLYGDFNHPVDLSPGSNIGTKAMETAKSFHLINKGNACSHPEPHVAASCGDVGWWCSACGGYWDGDEMRFTHHPDAQDTHIMPSSGYMCTSCPVPCQRCRAGKIGTFCENTPCSCNCHPFNATTLKDGRKTYRVGRKVGNTLYLGDTFIGSCVSPEAAAKLVEAANRGIIPDNNHWRIVQVNKIKHSSVYTSYRVNGPLRSTRQEAEADLNKARS